MKEKNSCLDKENKKLKEELDLLQKKYDELKDLYNKDTQLISLFSQEIHDCALDPFVRK